MFKDTFERESFKLNDDMKEELNGLKQSFTSTFNSLSDIMLEEFEAIRNELQSGMNQQYCPMHRTIEHLTLISAKSQGDISHLLKRQDFIESQISKISPKDHTAEIESIKGQLLTNKEDYRGLYDQMSDIIASLNDEVNIIRTDNENCTQSIKTIKTSINELNQSMKLSSK